MESAYQNVQPVNGKTMVNVVIVTLNVPLVKVETTTNVLHVKLVPS